MLKSILCQLGFYQIGPYQIGPYQIGPYQIGPYQIGPYQIAALKAGVLNNDGFYAVTTAAKPPNIFMDCRFGVYGFSPEPLLAMVAKAVIL